MPEELPPDCRQRRPPARVPVAGAATAARLLREPREAWPTSLLVELCRDLDLVHVADPMHTETVTPGQTCYRLHGTTGVRHVLRDLVADRPAPYVMSINLPRAGDAERSLALLRPRRPATQVRGRPGG